MKTTFRITALLLALCTLFAACSKADGFSNNGVVVTTGLKGKDSIVGNIKCEFPLVDDDTSLNILTVGSNNIKAENVFVWQKYEEMTGVKVNWTTVQKSKRAETVANALSNRTQLDLIMRCKISSRKLTQYGESGLILDLAKDDLLKKYAPNCWAFLQSHPDALASVTNPDGAIYALPQVNSGAELRVSRKIFINKTWFKNVNMSVPTTTEEFYQLLKAFKEQDANGNGDLTDEIPLCSADWLSLQESFYGAFGLANRGLHNMVVDSDNETKNVRLITSSERVPGFSQLF